MVISERGNTIQERDTLDFLQGNLSHADIPMSVLLRNIRQGCLLIVLMN